MARAKKVLSPDEVLAEVYAEHGVSIDRLPYTAAFDTMFTEVTRKVGARMTKAEFWRLITNARKAGKLPKIARG